MLAARRLNSGRAPSRRKPVRPALFQPIENAIAEAPQRRDVVGQKHEAERKHPEAENRQDGKEPADDQQYAGREARPARGWLPEPPCDRLQPAWQAAKEPPQPSLRVGIGVIIGRGHGLRAQALKIGSPAMPRNP